MSEMSLKYIEKTQRLVLQPVFMTHKWNREMYVCIIIIIIIIINLSWRWATC